MEEACSKVAVRDAAWEAGASEAAAGAAWEAGASEAAAGAAWVAAVSLEVEVREKGAAAQTGQSPKCSQRVE